MLAGAVADAGEIFGGAVEVEGLPESLHDVERARTEGLGDGVELVLGRHGDGRFTGPRLRLGRPVEQRIHVDDDLAVVGEQLADVGVG